MTSSIVRSFLLKMFAGASDLNQRNILSFVSNLPEASLLDLGCHDGTWSLTLAAEARTSDVSGVDIQEDQLAIARSKGVNGILADLSQPVPFESDKFDIVHANQVIEHLPDLDLFMAEIYRLLKPGGRAIISTENASSWHNIFASIMGWQMFSLTNFSSRMSGIGNPLALHRGTVQKWQSWNHRTILNYAGLLEYFRVFRYTRVFVKGAGYYPLPAIIGRLDPRHSHFLTICAIK